MPHTNTLDYVVDILFSPVPFLPDKSFVKRPEPLDPRKRRALKAKGGPLGNEQSFSLTGPLEKGKETPYAILGEDFIIDKDTWLFGEVAKGSTASVQGIKVAGIKYAKKIIIK